ncbi:hypothetical protein COLO4_10963 [Corchorus olitorius]|uniref:Uncharacterized protein n=1 Tax=Corchorus olitorius TaxID=93759 RepID=A0A1R3K6A0_9ROSI|nr:hypothetical protein COLO4_10963 [Corchorus olitorius]
MRRKLPHNRQKCCVILAAEVARVPRWTMECSDLAFEANRMKAAV